MYVNTRKAIIWSNVVHELSDISTLSLVRTNALVHGAQTDNTHADRIAHTRTSDFYAAKSNNIKCRKKNILLSNNELNSIRSSVNVIHISCTSTIGVRLPSLPRIYALPLMNDCDFNMNVKRLRADFCTESFRVFSRLFILLSAECVVVPCIYEAGVQHCNNIRELSWINRDWPNGMVAISSQKCFNRWSKKKKINQKYIAVFFASTNGLCHTRIKERQ